VFGGYIEFGTIWSAEKDESRSSNWDRQYRCIGNKVLCNRTSLTGGSFGEPMVEITSQHT